MNAVTGKMGTAMRCVGFAALIAVIVAGVSYVNLLTQSRAERIEIAALSEAFLDVYSSERTNEMPVPAAFRRLALEAYEQENTRRYGRLSLTMPGMPGHEIRGRSEVPSVNDVIASFEGRDVSEPVVMTEIYNGRLIDRTILPSLATSEACVSCHISLETGRDWVVGDVMGAFVLESDLTEPVRRILGTSGIVFCFGLICFFLLLAMDQNRDRRHVEQLEEEIEARRRHEEEEVRFLALNDPLTRIGNRAYLSDAVRELGAKRDNFHLFIVDLDRFKRLNDEHGHAAGDAVLVHVAHAIKRVMAPFGGKCARLGGDEFAAVLPDRPNIASPQKIGETLMAEINAPIRSGEKVLKTRCSIGIAWSGHAALETFEHLNHAADAALYEAKREGRFSVSVYGEELHSRLQSRRRMEEALPNALSDGEFDIHYQPQVDLSSNRLRGFEALLRWRHDGQPISPAELVPILEDNGLICDVDLWVLENALAQVAAWDAQGLEPVNMSINLSPVHFQDNAVAKRVAGILAASPVAPERVTLEITETILLSNWDDVTSILDALKALGVQIALDDFGTGYSSLAYLRNLKVDEIKIDRAFLIDIETSEETRFLFDGIAEMAAGLGRRLVVEGIETPEQRDLVMAQNGRVGQGFLFGRPTSAEDARALIAPQSKAGLADLA